MTSPRLERASLSRVATLAAAMFLIAIALVTAGLIAPAHGATVDAAERPVVRTLAPGQLVLRNEGLETVHVEVRAGELTQCGANDLVGRRAVPPERTWAISARRPLCWRAVVVVSSTAEPDWGAWQRVQVVEGTRQVRALEPVRPASDR